MQKIVMKTDAEPVDPDRNPIITREEAAASGECRDLISAMDALSRDSLTRLQYVEYLMWENEVSRWNWEYEMDWLPMQLSVEWVHDEGYYIPQYLIGKLSRKINPFLVEG